MSAETSRSEITSWVVTDGKAGMESQCLGLAEALGLAPVVKRVVLRTPWRQLTPHLRLAQRYAFASSGDRLEPPWPVLLIATGRMSVAASLFVRAQSRTGGGKGTLTVQLQNPVISPSHFDLVVTPRHDGLKGENVLATRGALHRVNETVLKESAEKFLPQIADLPRPYIVVLLGGSNTVYRLTAEDMAPLARRLVAAAHAASGSLLITPSRRTGADVLAALKAELNGVAHYLWDEEGDNPYFGLLGLADFLIVTCDSVNMVSEASATGKPVYVAYLPGGSKKFRRFHAALQSDGVTRPFEGTLAPYSYAPLDDIAMAAARVRALLEQRGQA